MKRNNESEKLFARADEWRMRARARNVRHLRFHPWRYPYRGIDKPSKRDSPAVGNGWRTYLPCYRVLQILTNVNESWN